MSDLACTTIRAVGHVDGKDVFAQLCPGDATSGKPGKHFFLALRPGTVSSRQNPARLSGDRRSTQESQHFSPIDSLNSSLLGQLRSYAHPCPHPSKPTTRLPPRQALALRRSSLSTASSASCKA